MEKVIKMLSKNKIFFSAFLTSLSLTVSAQALETQARNLILVDYETGQTLYQKEAQKMVPPASMSKLMTIYMIFDKIKDGTLSLEKKSASEICCRELSYSPATMPA